ncbi:hypothetical protein EV421DRAFT_1903281 [Armillaria borealis]|uniref:Ribonuclease H1 N-terminal domain-containing protein n=1 Tax=Armillaria borealis TaxID=47425 RepID=A0AA39JK83_9AGAR|nr:hypothetical protein EV421DRAFT_1903281 [Armillaria borealis]
MTCHKSNAQSSASADVDVLLRFIESLSLSDIEANDIVRVVLQNTVAPPSSGGGGGASAPAPSGSSRRVAPPNPGPPIVTSVTCLGVDFAYHVPVPGAEGPFYIVTRGTDVGIFSGWEETAPLVLNVSGCSYRGVPSYDDGIQCVESALARGKCALLPRPVRPPSPPAFFKRGPRGGPPAGGAGAGAAARKIPSILGPKWPTPSDGSKRFLVIF